MSVEDIEFMKIYLDNCTLQRPLDDKTQTRIRLESEAVLSLVEGFQAGKIELVSSEILDLELDQTSLKVRRDYGHSVLKLSKVFVTVTESVENQASKFVKKGIKPFDALHLASAESAKVSYLCTCDDRFLKKAKMIGNLNLKVVSPLELIEELEL